MSSSTKRKATSQKGGKSKKATEAQVVINREELMALRQENSTLKLKMSKTKENPPKAGGIPHESITWEEVRKWINTKQIHDMLHGEFKESAATTKIGKYTGIFKINADITNHVVRLLMSSDPSPDFDVVWCDTTHFQNFCTHCEVCDQYIPAIIKAHQNLHNGTDLSAGKLSPDCGEFSKIRNFMYCLCNNLHVLGKTSPTEKDRAIAMKCLRIIIESLKKSQI